MTIELNKIYNGNVFDVLKTWPDGFIQTVVTSPPYWGLRNYGTNPQIWDANPSCEHIWQEHFTPPKGGKCHPDRPSIVGNNKYMSGTDLRGVGTKSDFCQSCNAWKGELGLEPTPELYVKHITDIFREIRRTLRDDGTLWLNLGDSYAGSGGAGNQFGQLERGLPEYKQSGRPQQIGLKPKDLIGIPWRVAFALQADGWYLRQDIIWHKPAVMPESVTDRCTKSHEYIFLLTKSPKYFYDSTAIKEPTVTKDISVRRRDVTRLNNTPGRTKMSGLKTNNYLLRNKRSVWSVNTKPFRQAHFACVDADTECLTINGWKYYRDLTIGEMAAQYDLQSQTLSWSPIEDVATYDVTNESMVYVKSRDLEMLLTPNHRTIIQRRHNRTRKVLPPTIIEASDLKHQHAIPISANWVNEFAHTTPISPEWAELIGWYVAEGHQSKTRHGVFIYQSLAINPRNVERIRYLLTSIGANFSEKIQRRQWRGRDSTMVNFYIKDAVADQLRKICPQKALPKNVLSWNMSLLTSLLRGLVKGDGHTRQDGRFSFIQRNKICIDTVQAIGVRLGYATMCTKRKDSSGVYCLYFTNRKCVSLRGTNGVSKAQIKMKKYTGVVWCPKLSLGTWVARKNGRVFITGNTYPTALVTPMVLAGTSEKGCCSVCCAPWKRIVEKTTSFEGGSGKAGRNAEEVNASGKWKDMQHGENIKLGPVISIQTTGWEPTCKCEVKETVPCVVFDPFMGAGTTALVAKQNRRSYVGVELNPEYLRIAEKRVLENLK